MRNQPEIFVSSTDLKRIYDLLDSLPSSGFVGREELENELKRATEVEPDKMPADVVTMNSTVKFIVESTGKAFELTLVYPKDLDKNGKTISILAPVGSALLGIREGDQIEWPKPGGGFLKVKIEKVMYQPEREGEYHR